jgi:hypothetical protein
MKWIRGNAVFIAALFSEAVILLIHWKNNDTLLGISIDIGFLWYNVIGCLCVMVFAAIIQGIFGKRR